MSLCSPSIRAISRSRPKTLLPFLYQTATIQHWKPATRPHARCNISSRSRPTDDIPFEDADGNLPPALEEAQSARKTTITDVERAAFEKLYKTFNTQGQGRQKNKSIGHEEQDQIADEYYEDDEDLSSGALDKMFDAVLQGSPRSQVVQRGVMNSQPRTSNSGGVSPGKETQALDADTPRNKKMLATKAEKERFKKLRLEERERVDNLLKSAQSDRELWRILEQEVFDQLRKLNLDETDLSKKDSSKPNVTKFKPKPPTNSTVDTRILFPNYPHHLLTALVTLRTNFPGSPLALTILPTIKAIGRSSYALGATPKLYKHLLRTAWLQQSSYTMIDTLLTDMESNIVEFDLDILEVLDAVIKEHETATSGRLGREMQMVYGMDMWMEGIRKIKVWRGVVADRLGVQEKEDNIQERAVRQFERAEQPVREDPRRMYMNSERAARGTTWTASKKSDRAAGADAWPGFKKLELARRNDDDRRGNQKQGARNAGYTPLVEGAQPLQSGNNSATIGSVVRFVGVSTVDTAAKDIKHDDVHRKKDVDAQVEHAHEENGSLSNTDLSPKVIL
jgi:hypothetical protein